MWPKEIKWNIFEFQFFFAVLSIKLRNLEHLEELNYSELMIGIKSDNPRWALFEQNFQNVVSKKLEILLPVFFEIVFLSKLFRRSVKARPQMGYYQYDNQISVTTGKL